MPDPTSEKVHVSVLNIKKKAKTILLSPGNCHCLEELERLLLSYLGYPLLISVQKYTSIMLETLKVKFDTDIYFPIPLTAGACSLQTKIEVNICSKGNFFFVERLVKNTLRK